LLSNQIPTILSKNSVDFYEKLSDLALSGYNEVTLENILAKINYFNFHN